MVSQHQHLLSIVAGRLSSLLPGRAESKPGRALAARVAASDPAARRGRTAAVVSMYALVAFTVTFVSLVSALLSSQVARRTAAVRGGFDAMVISTPQSLVPIEQIRAVPSVTAVAPLTDADIEIDANSANRFQPYALTAFDQAYIAGGPAALVARRSGFSTDADVYRNALDEIGATVIALPDSDRLGRSGLKPGRQISARDPSSGRSITMTIAGVIPTSSSKGTVWVSSATFASLFARNPVPDRYIVAGTAGAELATLLTSLRSATSSADGSTIAEVESIGDRVRLDIRSEVQFLRLLQGYISLGFLIGLIGLALVMMRSVHERRRQIGVLRSLGADGATIRRAFLIEACTMAFEGVMVGVILALATGWRQIGNGTFGEGTRLVIPGATIAALAAMTFTASILAALWPAQLAAKIRPAAALRLE